jgi:hypothetical protein
MPQSSDAPVGRLFLGGPMHGRRLVVEHDAWTYVVRVLPKIYELVRDEEPVDSREIVYTAHRVPGSRERVFVAPDYGFDTPEWLAFDTEGWAARMKPGVTDWQHHGPWRWSGELPEEEFLQGRLLLLGDGRGESYVTQVVDPDSLENAGSPGLDFMFDEMQREIDYQRLPACFVDGCDEKARGGEVDGLWLPEGRNDHGWPLPRKLAGPQKLCPEHFHDVLRMPPSFGLLDGPTLSQIPEWLLPYLRETPMSAFDQAFDLITTPEREYSMQLRLRHKLTGAWVTPEQYWHEGTRNPLTRKDSNP